MNYRKRIRILPGVTLNLSKSGISTTIGIKGFSVNVGQNGAYLNTGIPGTGLYQRQKIGNFNNQQPTALDTKIYEQVEELPSQDLTSTELFGLKTQIVDTYNERITIQGEIQSDKKITKWSIIFAIISGIISAFNFDSYSINTVFVIFAVITGLLLFMGVGFAISKSKKESILENITLKVDVSMDEQIETKFNELQRKFSDMQSTSRAYYIANQSYITNQVQQRTSASYTVTRNAVDLYKSFENNFIITPYQPIILNTVNDGTLLLYPGFLVIIYNNPQYNQNAIHVTKWKDINIMNSTVNFHEEDGVPNDSEIVGRTWKYVNKNGSPDKRYSYNPEIPIVRYYELTIIVSNKSGYCYYISNVNRGEAFYKAFEDFKSAIVKLDWNNDKKIDKTSTEEKSQNVEQESITEDSTVKNDEEQTVSIEKPKTVPEPKKEIDFAALEQKYKNALKMLPAPRGFSDAIVALRKMYKENPKEQYLKKLYELAVIDSFVLEAYSEIAQCTTFNIMEKAYSRIKTFPIFWNDIGYKEIELSKSDIKLMVDLWGEPENHTTFHAKYKDLYKEIELKLKKEMFK